MELLVVEVVVGGDGVVNIVRLTYHDALVTDIGSITFLVGKWGVRTLSREFGCGY
jgi:hypothetical protein